LNREEFKNACRVFKVGATTSGIEERLLRCVARYALLKERGRMHKKSRATPVGMTCVGLGAR